MSGMTYPVPGAGLTISPCPLVAVAAKDRFMTSLRDVCCDREAIGRTDEVDANERMGAADLVMPFETTVEADVAHARWANFATGAAMSVSVECQ